MWKGLSTKVAEIQDKAYAAGTLENYRIQWALYFNFCTYFNRTALPAQPKTLVNYMVFLSKKLKSLGSIRAYMAGVSTLHELLEVDRSAFKSLRVKLMWMGLDRTIKYVPKRAAPMSPEVVTKMREQLYLEKANDAAFWALCLTAFFILARKSNLMPVKDFNPQQQLSHDNLQFDCDYVDVHLHWTKTRRPHFDPMVYPLV